MGVAILLIILAILLGGVGLAVEALRLWLIVAIVLLVAGMITGRGTRL